MSDYLVDLGRRLYRERRLVLRGLRRARARRAAAMNPAQLYTVGLFSPYDGRLVLTGAGGRSLAVLYAVARHARGRGMENVVLARVADGAVVWPLAMRAR